MMRRNWILFVPAAVLFIALFTFIGGELVRLLWNWLMPELFGLRPVTFWQACGLLALSRILVGGFGVHGGRRHGSGRSPLGDRIADRVAVRIAEKWDRMPPDERERWQQRVPERAADPHTS
jgi:hypothetical protein